MFFENMTWQQIRSRVEANELPTTLYSRKPMLRKRSIQDGSVIEANLKKGLADGLGTLTDPDGTIYTGNFDRGDLDCFVQKTKPDGTSEIVEFCYGDNMDDWDDEEWEEEEEFNDEAFEEFLNKFKGDNEDD